MISMKISGGPQLSKQLAALMPSKQRGVLTKILMHGGEPMQERMSELAPVEAGKPDIADHIVISVASRVQSPEVIGARAREEGEAVVAVGPAREFPYAIPLEFGHVSGKSVVSARPFVRPGFDEKSGESLKVIQEDIWAWLRDHSDRSVGGRTL